MANLSLNEIIAVLSDTVGQPFSLPLQERLKLIVTYKRANYMQQSMEKHPDQRKFFQQSFTTELEKISPEDCEVSGIACEVLRTKCEVPIGIRSSYTLYDYVGTPDWSVAYGETRPEFNTLRKFNKYTGDLPKWSYINKKIYVFNNLSLKKLSVRGVFADPFAINSCCVSGACFSADDPFPLPSDLLNAIVRDILQVELRAVFPQANIVEVPEVKDINRPVNA